ncbi:MAG: site-2 protease family protein [Pirellulales bacterium]
MSLVLFAAIDLYWLVPVVLKVAIGLGAVIFVHELGHFLVAKACGVKCEKFFIGFDIGGYKISKRVGETEYGIGILPLGGYVKMLGQDDDPAHIAEQMKKSQEDPASGDAVPIRGPNGETYYVNRRSYLAKSVPQRMAIISAGVIMNVIFAFIFAVIAYGMGVPYLPSVVAETMPGSPAWKAGIEPGDEIVRINDTVDPTFVQLKGGVTLGDLEHGIPCEIRRAADGKVVPVTLTPEQDDGRLATIGIAGPTSVTLYKSPPADEDSAAAKAKLIAPGGDAVAKDDAKFKGGDEIIRVGDKPIKDYRGFVAELARQPSEPLQVTVRRDTKKSDAATKGKDAADAGKTQELTFEVPPQALSRFDFEMRMGAITTVRDNSPAARAGLLPGDVIVAVDGLQAGTASSAGDMWTPQTLPEYASRAARDGREVEISVERPASDGKTQPVAVRVKPVVPMSVGVVPRSPGLPMAADAVGIAYRITNDVAAVQPNSSIAKDLAPGDRVTKVTFVLPADKDGETPKEREIKLMTDKPTGLAALIRWLFGYSTEQKQEFNWPSVLDSIQFLPEGTDVQLTVVRGDAEPRKFSVKPVVADKEFLGARGFNFDPIERIRKAESFSQQVRYGWDETGEALTMVFRFLRKLGTQVPISALGGPVTIAKAAGYHAAEGVSSLLVFLTMLSANLAVINLLPIPLLDGGHLVFLAYEGVRGRPANEKFVVALHTAGFVFIVSLMLYVLSLDLGLIPRDL